MFYKPVKKIIALDVFFRIAIDEPLKNPLIPSNSYICFDKCHNPAKFIFFIFLLSIMLEVRST
jgi:hypothetical protein